MSSHDKCDQYCSCDCDFEEWYVRHIKTIHSYVLSKTLDPTLAEDCTSQTFLNAFARRERFRCHGHGIRPWLFAIARNIVRDLHRSGWFRCETPIEDVPDGINAVCSSEEQLLRSEMNDALTRYIDTLPNEQAQCVRLRFIQELSVAETARTMQRGEGAVRAPQYRAIRKLRTMLTPSGSGVRSERQERSRTRNIRFGQPPCGETDLLRLVAERAIHNQPGEGGPDGPPSGWSRSPCS